MKVSHLKQIIKEEIYKVLKEAQLDPKNQELKNKYIDAYVTLTIDPYAFDESDDWENAPSFEDIEAHAKEFGYEDTLRTIDRMEDVRALRNKLSPYGSQDDPLKAKTPGAQVDNLSMRDPMMYLTKAGKMNKLDVDRLKLRIKKNLGINEKKSPSFSNPLEGYSDEYKELLKKVNRTLDLKERNKLIDAMNALPDRKRLGLKPLTKVK